MFKLCTSSLRELTFTQCTSSALEIFVNDENNNSIETLKLYAIVQSTVKNSRSLTRIYNRITESFSALVHLDIASSITANDFFKSDISDIATFKLREFQVQAPPESSEAFKNIEKFIIAQGTSLEEICLLMWPQATTIYRIWNDTKGLKVFQMSNVKSFLEFDDMTSFRIVPKKLKLLCLNFPQCVIVRNFLCPLLETCKERLGMLDVNVEFIAPDLLEEVITSATNVIVNNISYVLQASSDIDSDSISDCESANSSSSLSAANATHPSDYSNIIILSDLDSD